MAFPSCSLLFIVFFFDINRQMASAALPAQMPQQAKTPAWLNNGPPGLVAQVSQLVNDKSKSPADVQNALVSMLANDADVLAKFNAAKQAHQNKTGALERIKAIFEQSQFSSGMSLQQIEDQANAIFKSLPEADQDFVAGVTQCGKNAGEMASTRQKRQYGYGCGCYYYWCGCYYCYYCYSCYGGYNYYYG